MLDILLEGADIDRQQPAELVSERLAAWKGCSWNWRSPQAASTAAGQKSKLHLKYIQRRCGSIEFVTLYGKQVSQLVPGMRKNEALSLNAWMRLPPFSAGTSLWAHYL
jgi:hypothetical protein